MRTCLLQTHSNVNEDLYQLTLPNHAAYAGVHGYDMHQVNRSYKEVWWGIEDLILDLLPRYDRILTVGSDVIFTNMGMPLDEFDDGEHSVFITEEGLGSAWLNFDVVLWTKSAGVRDVIAALRETRPRYVEHPWGLQAGIAMLASEPHMQHLIGIYGPRTMQSSPYIGHPGMWYEGDFALHFVGMSNKDKLAGCREYLEKGSIAWRRNVGRNDG